MEAGAEANLHSVPGTVDNRRFAAYTSSMSTEDYKPAQSCLCGALRRASRAVSRLYDEELRGVGLRTTQFSLLHVIQRAGQVRQGDLSELTSLDETTLTRNLRPLLDARWIAVCSGDDRREKLVTITKAGTAKLAEARAAWERRSAAAGGAARGDMAGPPGDPPGDRAAHHRGVSFFAHIDAYTGFCRGRRLAACCPGGAMATLMEVEAEAGGSPQGAGTSTPQGAAWWKGRADDARGLRV